MTLSVGLVGFGLAGRVLHAPLILHAGMRIASVVTSQADLVHSSIPGAQVFNDVDSLLASNSLDIVVITTPNHLHTPEALAALQAGKHVVIDKPMCITGSEASTLIKAAHHYNRTLTVFHNRRWDSDFLTLKKLLHENTLGDITEYEANWDRWRPEVGDRWRDHAQSGSGMLFDLGPHLIDQALMLFGMPEWLQADVYQQRAGAATDDAFVIRMGKGSLRITLSVNSLAVTSRARFRVQGLRGTWIKYGLDIQESQLRSGMTPDQSEFGLEPSSSWGVLSTPDSEERQVEASRGNWSVFYENLVQHLGQQAPLAVTAAQAMDVINIIAAARDSSERGVRVKL